MTDRSRYATGTETESFTAGETIFKQGELGRVMYVVLSGEVELTHDTPHFALEVMQSLSQRLRRANDRDANGG